MSALAPLLWAFLPSRIAHLLVPYLSSFLPSIFPAAPKDTPGYQRTYRWAYTLLVGGYIAWSFAALDGGGGGGVAGGTGDDWYKLLGVRRDAEDDELKRAYRALSRIYHPDRAPSSGEHFILVRRAYECLSDPVKRYAYDRFGPDILSWKAASFREYTRQGITQSAGFYVFSGGIMAFLGIIGRAQEGSYWRNALFVSLLIAELRLITFASSTLSHPLLPSLLDQPAFLQVRLLHRLFTSASIGISQLGAVWADKTTANEDSAMRDALAAAKAIESEALGGFQEVVVPLLSRGNPAQVEKLLLDGMEQALIDRAVATHPQIRPIWTEAQQTYAAHAHKSSRHHHHHHHQQHPRFHRDDAPGYREVYPRLPPPGYSEVAPQILHAAMQRPLPPSPPGSPRLGPRGS